MKLILLTFSLFYFTLAANAQFPRLVVQLKDKGHNTFSFSTPSRFLSARAINRRLLHNTPIDSLDLPVAQEYLDSIKSVANVSVLSTSRWLNEVLIETTDQDAISKIQSLPF